MALHVIPIMQHLTLPLCMQLRDVVLRRPDHGGNGFVWVVLEGKRSFSCKSGMWLVTPVVELGNDIAALEDFELQLSFVHNNGGELGNCSFPIALLVQEYLDGNVDALQRVNHLPVTYENCIGDVSFTCQLTGLPRRAASLGMLKAYCESLDRRKLLPPTALLKSQHFARRRYKQYATMLEEDILQVGSQPIHADKAVKFWLKEARKNTEKVRAIRGLVAALTQILCVVGGVVGDNALQALGIIVDGMPLYQQSLVDATDALNR